VGRKTANVVLGVAFGIPGFAVDTHVIRLSGRLGLTKNSDPIRIESDVTRMVAPEEWTGLSLRLILHGRRICVARAPRCLECVMNDFCPASALRSRRAPRDGSKSRTRPLASGVRRNSR
jgi:endonuclease-3